MKEIEMKKELESRKKNIEETIIDALRDVGMLDQKTEENVESAIEFYKDHYLTEVDKSLEFIDPHKTGITIQSVRLQVFTLYSNAISEKYTDTIILYLLDVLGSVVKNNYPIRRFNLYNLDIFNAEFYDDLIELRTDIDTEIDKISYLVSNSIISALSTELSLSEVEDDNVVISTNNMDLIDQILLLSLDFIKDITETSIKSCLNYYNIVYGL